jgi:hypothetical protein
MNKTIKIFISIVIVLAICSGIFYLYQSMSEKKTEEVPQSDYKNIYYGIEGQEILLQNGSAETAIVPGSASKAITKYFGNEVRGDFNGDGTEDIAFLLTQDPGGSGTFYYIVAALNISGGYSGTNAIFLGDRIAPQSTEFKDGEIVVNYADRNPDDPMTAAPTLGVSKHFKVVGGELVEASDLKTE